MGKMKVANKATFVFASWWATIAMINKPIMSVFLQTHWFDLVQTIFIVAGFAIATVSLRNDTKGRRIEHLMEIIKGHREVWMSIINKPELARVFEKELNLQLNPITPEEDRIVRLSIMHLYSAYEASKHWLKDSLPGIGKDIEDYFSCPIPIKVWRDVKELQNKDFVAFVESNLKQEDS